MLPHCFYTKRCEQSNTINVKKKLQVCVILIFVLSISACMQTLDNKESGNPPSSSIRFQILKAPIGVNEDVKIVAELVNPAFEDKNSNIIVVVEIGEKNILKTDLSNQKDAKLAIFQNLSKDTVNSKFVQATDLKRTAIFGKSFKNPGIQKIRGYVMEFYDFEIYRGYDITNVTLNSDKISRTFFETEIEVISE